MQQITGRLQALDEMLSRQAWYRVVRNGVLAFNQRDGSRKAAAMTYFAIFSIFPLVLLMIVALSFVLDTEEAREQAVDLLSAFLPAGRTEVEAVIEDVIDGRGVALGFGTVLLLWGVTGWFQAIDQAINEVWGIQAIRSFIRGRLFALAMIAGIGLVMLASWLANFALGIARTLVDDVGLDVIPGDAVLWDVVIWVVTLGLVFLVFLTLYRFSPLCRLTWGDVWRGALVTAFVWSVVRSLFAIYVTYFADFGSAYGPIGAAIVLLVWLYVAHMIILGGAAITYSTRLEAQGIHDLRDLPCGLPPEEERDRDRPAA